MRQLALTVQEITSALLLKIDLEVLLSNLKIGKMAHSLEIQSLS